MFSGVVAGVLLCDVWLRSLCVCCPKVGFSQRCGCGVDWNRRAALSWHMKAEAERFATSVNVLPLHHLDARHP